jgi:ABC-type uncharacterized transport system permease subunit
VMTTLSDYTRHIQSILGLSMTTNLDLNGVLSCWLSGKQRLPQSWRNLLPPSWRSLLLIVRLLRQDELAQRMETCLSAEAIEELSPTRGKQGEWG